MERLRIEPCRERLDLLGGERMAAERRLVADADVLEILHAGAPRRPMRLMFSWVIISAPVWSRISKRNLTRPQCGRLLSGRLSRMVRRSVSRSPGRTGWCQRTSSIPGEPLPAAFDMKTSEIMPQHI